MDEIERVILPLVWGGTKHDFYRNLKCRRKGHVVARRFIFMFGRLFTKLSLDSIGLKYMKDHSTVCTGIDTLLFQLYQYEDIKRFFLIIMREFDNSGVDVSAIREHYNNKTLREPLRFSDDKKC